VNDVSALRRRKKEEREAALWSSRLAQLQQAVTDSQPDIEAAVLQARNCLQLWDQVHHKVEKDLPDSSEGDTAGEEAKKQGRAVVHRDDLERTVVDQEVVVDQPESEQEIVIVNNKDSEKNEKEEDKEGGDREEHERDVSDPEVIMDGRVMVDKVDDDEAIVEQTEEDKAVVEQTEEDKAMGEQTEEDKAMVEQTEEDKAIVEQVEEDKAVVDSLVDQHSEISKRWLPLVKKWLETLTKAGRRTDHQMLRQVYANFIKFKYFHRFRQFSFINSDLQIRIWLWDGISTVPDQLQILFFRIRITNPDPLTRLNSDQTLQFS
jgi:hypothetical protein